MGVRGTILASCACAALAGGAALAWPAPAAAATLPTKVHNLWDRGLLGALVASHPAGLPALETR
jgi:hypothetical protein